MKIILIAVLAMASQAFMIADTKRTYLDTKKIPQSMVDSPWRLPSLLELNQFIDMDSIGTTLAEFNEGFFTGAQADMTSTSTTCYIQSKLVSADIKVIFNITAYSDAGFDIGKLM